MELPIYLASRIVRHLPRQSISKAVGKACDAPLPEKLSRFVVSTYAKAYHVDMQDVEPRTEPYVSFDDFFTRRLVPGARPMPERPGVVVSPADGFLQAVGRVESGCRIVVKGRPYDVSRLVGDEKEAKKYTGGQFAVVYLSPSDYHRVHAPIDGHVPWIRGIAGDLFPVNKIGEKATRSLLVENERVVVPIDTKDQGRLLVILVGAMIVGRISVTMLDKPDVPPGVHMFSSPFSLRRGDELGAFHLGSTVVLLSAPGAPAWTRDPGQIRVGASLETSQ